MGFSLYCYLNWGHPVVIIIIIIIGIIGIIGIQPLGRSGQRPDFSQATGMTLVRCILGKFLGVGCNCFPPLFRRSHFSPPGASTSATTWQIQYKISNKYYYIQLEHKKQFYYQSINLATCFGS